MPVRRPLSEGIREFEKINSISLFETRLANLMLLGVMAPTKAQGPSVGRLQALSSVRAAADMRALDR